MSSAQKLSTSATNTSNMKVLFVIILVIYLRSELKPSKKLGLTPTVFKKFFNFVLLRLFHQVF